MRISLCLIGITILCVNYSVAQLSTDENNIRPIPPQNIRISNDNVCFKGSIFVYLANIDAIHRLDDDSMCGLWVGYWCQGKDQAYNKKHDKRQLRPKELGTSLHEFGNSIYDTVTLSYPTRNAREEDYVRLVKHVSQQQQIQSKKMEQIRKQSNGYF